MRHFNIRKNQYFQPIINLDKLWSLVGNEVSWRVIPHLTSCSIVVAMMIPGTPQFSVS